MSFARVLLRGTLGASENWSVGVAYRRNVDGTSFTQSEVQAAAAAIAAIDLGADLGVVRSTAVRSTTVRLEIRTDANDLVLAAEAPWTKLGSSGSGASKPAQTSLVFSLRSTVPGSRHRGRIYWPALAATINADTLRLTTVATQAYATQMAAYLDDIETALKEQLDPSPSLNDWALAVYSPTNQSLTDITRIEVGDILDVQRRRRDSLPESYSSAPYPG